MTKLVRCVLYAVAVAFFVLACQDIWQSYTMHKEQVARAQAHAKENTLLQEEIMQLRCELKNAGRDIDILKSAVLKLQDSTPGVYVEHLRGVICSTLAHLGADNVAQWERLLTLTVAAESNMGRYTRQLRGPANGMTQVEPDTERDALRWLAKHEPAMSDRLKSLRVPARLSIHEAEYNSAYSIALAYAVYRMRGVEPKAGYTAEDLAGIYKRAYNTARGKAQVADVLAKLTAYGVNI